ncbi:hypothetical protein IV02_16155 [Pseudomonas syringae]|uniref:Uncharacterized protein n=1 Tax=Pseudomonas syringae TaxID=317 RepID=A0A085V684_PSESX|nr:hypothetical protein IV02_16155 [Pseudomonas syringae]
MVKNPAQSGVFFNPDFPNPSEPLIVTFSAGLIVLCAQTIAWVGLRAGLDTVYGIRSSRVPQNTGSKHALNLVLLRGSAGGQAWKDTH